LLTTDSPILSVSQAEKKSLKLSLAPATKKQSLFSSPAAVDGKVGVTGSGQGMTDYEHRKRYKFNIGNT
jgi:N-acetyl-gamma-glutamylphosphate reductase